jgi:hypothetical protein
MRTELALCKHLLAKVEEYKLLAFAVDADLDMRISARRLRAAMRLAEAPPLLAKPKNEKRVA